MILLLGGMLGERVLQRRRLQWVAVFSLLAAVMVMAERKTFRASKHLELPKALGSTATTDSPNKFEQAFGWISRNTPRDALFALDAQYISEPGEDAQGFRAIAERSALPDFSKDGGVVTNKPELATDWLRGEAAQAGLSVESDAERVAALRPLGVTWVVLKRNAKTGFVCEYGNETVKVCRLP
jgi:hypothetical protein